jgi:hypothetical protein
MASSAKRPRGVTAGRQVREEDLIGRVHGLTLMDDDQ